MSLFSCFFQFADEEDSAGDGERELCEGEREPDTVNAKEGWERDEQKGGEEERVGIDE